MHKPFRDTAFRLIEAGHSPVPIVPGTKRPALAGWQRLCNAPLSPDEIERIARSPIAYGVGVALGFNGLVAIDVDTDDAEIVAAIRDAVMSTLGKAGSRGLTVFGRDPGGGFRTRHFAGMADILAHGSQTVLPPTPHPAGVMYRWMSPATLLDTPISALPIIDPDIADRLAATLAPWSTTLKPVRKPAQARLQPCVLSANERERQQRYAVAILARELPALASMASNTGRNQSAFRIVCRVGRWVHHGIIAQGQFVADVLDVCEHNGLVRDDGRKAVLATIASGLARSAGDTLPDLGARHG